MTEEKFWEILGLMDWSQEGEDSKVLSPVIEYLSGLPDLEIFKFEDLMSGFLYALDSKELAEGLYGSHEFFSGDLFLYQRCVAIVNGKEYYEAVLNHREQLNPDLEFESVLYVPATAWAKKHGQDLEDYPHCATPSYESCSNKELW